MAVDMACRDEDRVDALTMCQAIAITVVFIRGSRNVVHNLEAKRLVIMTEGRKHGTVIEFKADLIAHDSNPDDIEHVCMDVSAAYTKGVTELLQQAQISFDRIQVIALANATVLRNPRPPRSANAVLTA